MRLLKTTIVFCLLAINSMHVLAQDKKKGYDVPKMVSGMKVNMPQPQFSIDKPSLTQLRDMQRRTYVVLLAEEKPDEISELKNQPALLNEYKAGIKQTNENLKATLAKFWKICPDSNIMYKTLREFEAMPNKSNYLVVFCYNCHNIPDIISAKEPVYKCGMGCSTGRMKSYDKGLALVNYDIPYFAIEKPETNEIIYSVALPDIFPTKADLAKAINMASATYNVYKNYATHDFDKMDSTNSWLHITRRIDAPDLKNKTLLIRKDWIGTKISEKDLQSLYPYKYKIVSSDELDEAVMQGSSNLFLYIQVDCPDVPFAHEGDEIPMFRSRTIYVRKTIVDASNLLTLSVSYQDNDQEAYNLVKDDIKQWIYDSHIETWNAGSHNNCPLYAGIMAPVAMYPKDPNASKEFVFKSLGLDSCSISIAKPGYSQISATSYKTVFESRQPGSEYWNGTVDGKTSYGGFYYVIYNSSCGHRYITLSGNLFVVK